jgi:YbbR domain-containing protein
MRKLLSNKLYLMLVSVLIAFIVWVSVVSISNPDTNGSKAVTVEERNASELIASGKAYTIQGNKTVKVNYTVQARDAYKVKSSDFRAYVDLSDIYETTGTVRVMVQTVNNQDIISDCSVVPQTLQVVVEDIITKTVDVKVYKMDQCPEGYQEATSTTSVSQVEITGPRSLIDSIDTAGVEVSLQDATKTLNGNAPLKFFHLTDEGARAVDATGNIFFSASQYTTDYTVYVNAAKTVPVHYDTSGTPASGYHLSSTAISEENTVVTGNADVVGQISAVTIPASVLNIDGATSSRSWNVDLNAYLPAGAAVSGTSQVSITAVIEADAQSSSGGPGVAHTEAASSAADTSGSETTTESAETTQSGGGPGVVETQADETEEEKQSEAQSGTEAEDHTEAQTESDEETTALEESQQHTTAGSQPESRSHELTEVPSQTQSHTQAQEQTQSEHQSQSDTQGAAQE